MHLAIHRTDAGLFATMTHHALGLFRERPLFASPASKAPPSMRTRGEEDAPRASAAYLLRQMPRTIAEALTRSARQVGVSCHGRISRVGEFTTH